MATEIQKPKENELEEEEELPQKTLETVSNKPSLLTEGESVDKEVEHKESEASNAAETTLGSSTVEESAPVTDLQKKMRRAERFGMAVQLSEEEKRNSRAERFGTASTVHGSDELKKSEELKRKARAERFGLPAQSVADEEAKKKARQARFATNSKTDSVEEDKMKARAIRFSQTPAGGPSQTNGKASSAQESATVSKASGGT
ncbi:hypothetical protein BVC80_1835g646 [Macleaya cordata]|uniref:THO1-MOS11 C-terminal domain-containing protein n=1 Tax=Macleaya cordata TaxID=56857 RepID=A0A200R668_MACCD|nr:hypothetical protein BVC80_1835g646 [Macleaya cordata]